DVVFVAMAGACRVLQKEEIGRGAEKDAAAADLDAAGQIEARQVLAFGPDGDLVRLAGAGRVFEYFNAVTALFAGRRAPGVLIAFNNPEPPLLVDRKGDRVDDIRLGGEDLDLPAGRHAQAPERFFRSQIRLPGWPRVHKAEFALPAQPGRG